MTENEYRRALDVSLRAGVLLLKSGAEIRRVEDTVIRIASHFGMNIRATIFSLTNALFVSAEIPEDHIQISRVLQAPMKRMRLNHLILLNQFSRDIVSGVYSLEEAEKKIEEIECVKDPPYMVRIIAAFLTAFGFSFMFGGNLLEALLSALTGTLAFLFCSGPGVRISKLVSNFMGGMILALPSFLVPFLFPAAGIGATHVILGAMMPLVPGVLFMNSFRDFANGDYLSGTVRLLDAVLIGTCLAAGAAVVYRMIVLFGGVL